MDDKENLAGANQALGEFVITFQWIEHIYRQIGWFIADPEHKKWPPEELRKETTYELINKVTDIYVNFINAHVFPSGGEKMKDMLELKGLFHELRKYRNRLLHSTYFEMGTEDEGASYIRSNPEFGVDAETGELIYDQERFSAETIRGKLQEYSAYIIRLNIIHVQLIHWFPFDQHVKVRDQNA
jgi:hypothetical protein